MPKWRTLKDPAMIAQIPTRMKVGRPRNFYFREEKKTSFRLEGGISGRLPGEDPDEPAEATRESQTTTQAHSDNDDDNEHDQD